MRRSRTRGPDRPGQRTVRLNTVVRRGGPWIYRKMVRREPGRIENGSVVRVEDRNGDFVAQAFYNSKSELSLRVLSRRERPVVDERWFRRAVAEAVSLRRDLLGLNDQTDAWRAVFSEADHLPGLIVDRFGDVLSCQVSTRGIYATFRVLADELRRLFDPRVIHVAADPAVARIEGFPLPDGAGDEARTIVTEHGVRFHVDPATGHKTGFFLDQRDSRRRIRSLAEGRRVLDLCCYTGGFALNAAKGGAAEVVAVDLDENAVEMAHANAKLNRLSSSVRLEQADVFDVLRNLRGGEFDLIVVDPAKQAERRDRKPRAISYYEDLNTLAFEKVSAGGLVLTCSCTGVVSESEFLGALSAAASRARRTVQYVEIRGAPPDHPVPSDFPRARYLKCVLCLVS